MGVRNSYYARRSTTRDETPQQVEDSQTCLGCFRGSAWHMLTYRQPYQELGGDYFNQRRKEAKVSYLTRQLEKLTGGAVRIELQVITI